MKRHVICCDMDGTLSEGMCDTPEQARDALPIREYIDKVNELADRGHFICIYTARRDRLIPATLDWLRRNGVIFHAISNNKTPADCYIDDLAMKPSDL